MRNPFWNAKERRVRSLWRLLLQVLLFFILTGVLASVAVLVALFMAVVGGRSIPTPADPNFSQQVTELALGDPLAGVLLMLTSFLGIFLSVWLAGRLLDRRRLADFGFHFSPSASSPAPARRRSGKLR